MSSDVLIAVAAIGVLSLVLTALLVARQYRRVEPGTALLVIGPGPEPRVFLGGGALVMPLFQTTEVIDLSVQPIVITRTGREGLSCKDGIRADTEATFLLRVGATRDDVVQVARTIGCARATDARTLAELFGARFSEALKTVASQLEFEELHQRRAELRDQVIRVIGTDLGGYLLDDVAIDRLDQTPLGQLDPDNILDAQGIKKIKARTQRTQDQE